MVVRMVARCRSSARLSARCSMAKHDVERGYSTLRGYERSRNERKISRDEGITHFLGQQNIGSRKQQPRAERTR